MSAKQMALTTFAFVALIVMVTLVKVGLGGRGDSDKGRKSGDSEVAREHLYVPIKTIPDAGLQKPLPPPYAEINQDGHHDFYFRNDNDAPVEVFLSHVSCGRCVTMQIGLPPEGWQPPPTAAAGPPGEVVETQQPSPEPAPDVSWVTLKSEEGRQEVPGFTVPPKANGWFRLGWHDKEAVNEETLGAELRTNCSIGKAQPFQLAVRVRFLEPIRPLQSQLALDPIRSGSDKPQTGWFQVYSATRTAFTLEPLSEDEQKKRNMFSPFVTCDPPVALSEAECRKLGEVTQLPVRCGYKVRVKVSESAEGRQHDLGPFTDIVGLTSNALPEGDALKLTVTGTVEGLVTVLCGESHDNIALGSFRRSTGTHKTIIVETANPGADVALVVDQVPEFLDLSPPESTPQTTTDARKRWVLKVSVKSTVLEDLNVLGSLNEAMGDPAIYFKANGRRLRVPVSGNVLR